MRLSWIFLLTVLASLSLASGSGPDDDSDVSESESEGGWVYGKIEYLHDVLAPNAYFMVLRAHPGQPVPLITGGYATTDVYAVVRLRGVDTPRGLQVSEDRNRPHDWLAQERERWDAAMRYLWNVIAPTRTFKVHHLKVVDAASDKILEGDMQVLLGGQWMNLALMLLGDGHARPTQADGSQWEWGMETVPLLNPNIPK